MCFLSSQFVVLLYLLTYVGALTNGLTLVIAGEITSSRSHIDLLSNPNPKLNS